ncbi:sugar phosphate nucleotidyltransferase [Cohnella sp. WQ 127256]|uniref:sugar phosphate nucleotidyltransferase n=1 Tax=Cohnella sp. WQ 127256 TaxID=2938790 RepID=UPI0021192C5F|nr:sugar phosphate nucleotidyltransferase [Cohnella sp. WQ 127256]
MKLVLLSGGSGKRLWPLSNDSRSKQFLKVLLNDEGERESMVQRVWRQLGTAGLQPSTYLATNDSQFEVLRNQLGNQLRLIVEPERRDTYPSILLAASYLYSMEETDLDEVIIIMPVDPYVDAPFFERLKQLETALNESQAAIVLMGVQPTHPSEKYGYIIPGEQGDEAQDWRKIQLFHEKPCTEQAMEFIEQQAMWNCGVFALRLRTLIELLLDQDLPVQYQLLLEQYHWLPKISFDRAVVEKNKQVAVISYTGFWKDLGTWNTLTEEISDSIIGKGIISDDCTNTHLVNELDIPVAVIGLTDIIVAAGPDGIIVASKCATPGIKQWVEQIEQSPKYEELSWGHYRIIDQTETQNGSRTITKRVHMFAEKNKRDQLPESHHEIWTILSGSGVLVNGNQIMEITAGHVISMNANSSYNLYSNQEIEMIVTQTSEDLRGELVDRKFNPSEILSRSGTA